MTLRLIWCPLTILVGMPCALASAQTAAAKLEGNRYANTKACTAAKKYSSAKLAELVGNLANVGYGVVSGGAAAVDALEKIMAGFEW